MKSSELKSGGISAILSGLLYVFGFIALFTFMKPVSSEELSSKLAFLVANKTAYQSWMLLIYVVFGILLVIMTNSLISAFELVESSWKKITPIFGYIWAGLVIASGMIGSVGLNAVSELYLTDKGAAVMLWRTVEVVQDGLGGGVEIVGGVWVLLISLMGLKHPAFSLSLNLNGIIVSIAGTLTIIPSLDFMASIFGLTQIIWFIWVGIVIIQTSSKN